MCLGIPGQVVNWLNHDPLLALAEIDFGGIRKSCHMACVPEAREGDFVLVHAGVALTILDPDAALQTQMDLKAGLTQSDAAP